MGICADTFTDSLQHRSLTFLANITKHHEQDLICGDNYKLENRSVPNALLIQIVLSEASPGANIFDGGEEACGRRGKLGLSSNNAVLQYRAQCKIRDDGMVVINCSSVPIIFPKITEKYPIIGMTGLSDDIIYVPQLVYLQIFFLRS